MNAETTVKDALDNIINQFINLHQQSPALTVYDSKWPSDCYQDSVPEGDQVAWSPVKRNTTETMFERLGEALQIEIHPDICDFFSRYWSDPIPASCDEGELSLIQIWNEEDMERLRANLIGHALSKQKQRQPLTLFFATTEPDGDYFLSVDNETGEVLLEKPGKRPIRKLSDSLPDFLNSLTVLKIP